MTTQIRKTRCNFIVQASTEADGMMVPAGTYPGYSKELGVHLQGGLKWTKPTYHMTLDRDALDQVGASNNLLSIEVDVTKDVRSGAIKKT